MGQRLLVAGLVLLSGVAGVGRAGSAEDQQRKPRETAWGRIVPVPSSPADWRFEIRRWPADGRLPVPAPRPHVVRCQLDTAPDSAGASATKKPAGSKTIDFQFNRDATSLELLLPETPPESSAESPAIVRVTAAEKSGQLTDGRVILTALDATVEGSAARLESHPSNHRIGFWTREEDYVTWKYNATRWGMYEVLLTYSTAADSGSRIEVRAEPSQGAGEAVAIAGTLQSTGSWYRYTTRGLGKLYLAGSGPHTISVRCLEKVGGAVMNLKAVILIPACEGQRPEQADDGSVTLHARDATVHGTMLRWEPAEKKQTLGYWVRAEDKAEWTFDLERPGSYQVEVLQGCGKGQGGSRMVIRAGDQTVDWQVEETGHFQNFKPRVVGQLHFDQPGEVSLSIGCRQLANKAACDIRQIRLLPAR